MIYQEMSNLNNSPALESDYRNDRIAKEWHKKAIDDPSPSSQQTFIKEGFGAYVHHMKL